MDATLLILAPTARDYRPRDGLSHSWRSAGMDLVSDGRNGRDHGTGAIGQMVRSRRTTLC